MTFTELQKANATIITTPIKSKEGTKEYAAVNERIKVFRMLYPEGFIKTQILSNDNGVCVIEATVGYYTEKGEERILAVDHAYEKENSTFINKTSYIENGCTSACGRALGLLGIGIDTAVASAEEVQNAIVQQAAMAASKEQLNEIRASYPKEQLTTIAEYFGHKTIDELTEAEANKVLAKARKNK